MGDCARCSRGPEGLEGHLELTLCHDDQPRYGAAAGNPLFVCVSCAAKWERRYDGGGDFAWRRRLEQA
jgi:hypothetical protein